MTDANLESLVYVSSAVRLLNKEEIEHLLTKARERNEEYGITGVLLYIGGNFMQYIEGPADCLDVIYKIIQEDEKHTGIIMISRESIEKRQFGEWSMAFQTRELGGYTDSTDDKKLIDRILQIPPDDSTSARIVLRGFWERSVS